jgi:superfamily II RNA helicase
LLETYQGLALDRFQQQSMEAIRADHDVVVAAPTGAGKTLIAHYAIERALEAGKRVIYTAPIKALSNQKYRDLTASWPGQVGIATGDVSIDPDAPCVIMTTEIFRNTIFEDPKRLEDVAWVIFDEVHYLDDKDRGTVWEESLIFAPPEIRFLSLSATVSNLDELADWLRKVRDTTVDVVLERKRPVPLTVFVHSTDGGVLPVRNARDLRPAGRRGKIRRQRNLADYYLQAWHALVREVARREESPLLFFLFSRDSCKKLAMAASEDDFSGSPEAGALARDEFLHLAKAFDLDLSDPEVQRFKFLVSRGIAFHHAGILPALKEVIERLFTGGHIKLLCATETFALGVNMPARSVAFEGLRKWNGHARVPLRTREYQQMAGRAGRRGMDESGTVYLTVDPNREDPAIAQTLVNGAVEPVESQFNLSYGTLVNLYERLGDKLYEACERSFANFKAQRQRRDVHHDAPLGSGRHTTQSGGTIRRRAARPKAGKRGGKGRRGRRERSGRQPRRGRSERHQGQPPRRAGRYQDIMTQVRTKLGILSELEYLDSQGKVTPRGRFAMQVFGHEMPVTELVFGRVFDDLTPEQIAVVATAIVFESRKGVYYGGEDPRRILGKHVYRNAQNTIRNLWRLESERGVRDPASPLDWSLSGVTWAWLQGAEFSELRELTDASDGDVVRSLRQTIQLLRLAVRPLRELGRAPLAKRFREAQKLLKRGLVDAEWQLRRGAELEAERHSQVGLVESAESEESTYESEDGL